MLELYRLGILKPRRKQPKQHKHGSIKQQTNLHRDGINVLCELVPHKASSWPGFEERNKRKKSLMNENYFISREISLAHTRKKYAKTETEISVRFIRRQMSWGRGVRRGGKGVRRGWNEGVGDWRDGERVLERWEK